MNILGDLVLIYLTIIELFITLIVLYGKLGTGRPRFESWSWLSHKTHKATMEQPHSLKPASQVCCENRMGVEGRTMLSPPAVLEAPLAPPLFAFLSTRHSIDSPRSPLLTLLHAQPHSTYFAAQRGKDGHLQMQHSISACHIAQVYTSVATLFSVTLLRGAAISRQWQPDVTLFSDSPTTGRISTPPRCWDW